MKRRVRTFPCNFEPVYWVAGLDKKLCGCSFVSMNSRDYLYLCMSSLLEQETLDYVGHIGFLCVISSFVFSDSVVTNLI